MDRSIVSQCGASFIRRQQSSGVAATAKHFPGLGAAGASQNTDNGPVNLQQLTLHVMRTIDEYPFRTAIAQGVKMIMASWAIYPALDSEYPAGLSRIWIKRELRGGLGFQGVTITDALEAGALQAFGNSSARAVSAAQAGMDLLLASARDVSQGKDVLDGIVAALRSGEISKSEFAESTKRVQALRQTL